MIGHAVSVPCISPPLSCTTNIRTQLNLDQKVHLTLLLRGDLAWHPLIASCPITLFVSHDDPPLPSILQAAWHSK